MQNEGVSKCKIKFFKLTLCHFFINKAVSELKKLQLSL